MHARETIRDAIVTAVTGLTTTGARVYASRVHNLQDSNYPCLLVGGVSEEIEGPQSIGHPRRLIRRFDVLVEGRAQGANLDDTLDDIGQEVETALGADPTLGVNAVDTLLTTVEINLTADGTKPSGAISMRYRVTYITPENDPTTLV